MNQKKIVFLMILILAIAFSVFSCRSTVRYTQTTGSEYKGKPSGPPPHAPAHGYRHRHSDGVDLVYQSKLGVYLVAGSSDLYFHNDHFYRFHKNAWQTSAHVEGPWKPVKEKKLPTGLQKQKQKKAKQNKQVKK